MIEFHEYRDRFKNIRLERADGILEVTFHTEGDSLVWGGVEGGTHQQFASAFTLIAQDSGNKIVILLGMGNEFIGPAASPATMPPGQPEAWDGAMRNGMLLTQSLLSIDALVIAAVNGPALRHPEVPLLSDVVLAAPEATFQDTGHFGNRMVPGDGGSIFFPMLMGLSRARYYLLRADPMTADEAHSLGLVHEIHPRGELSARARAIAVELAKNNPLVLRYTRMLFTHQLRKQAHEMLGMGFAMEGLAIMDETERRKLRASGSEEGEA